MMEGIFIQWEVLAGVGLPSIVAATAVIRFYWNKTKCFVLLKKTVEDLSKSEDGSHNTHSDLYQKVNTIEKNVHLIMGKLEIQPVD